ncbi:DUF1330 domain-containing protein [Photobacterium ganghwense]|uniref:DUF1330 domain-containing protein n=1 Tax=Photobacterium ganghwense TaxID=320778 RepID=UPI001C2D019A|nr:DUF1330 domain-containing protein [Photobacterium ganghwense]MBV1842167.1 DUF1330 domain-containing protein [Photobacterium ganghwense]
MKGYWIAHVTVHHPEKYRSYTDLAPAAFQQFNGQLLARGGRFTQLEGNEHQRNVIIEFPSFEQALNCYHSDSYQKAKVHRAGIASAQVVIVEGV